MQAALAALFEPALDVIPIAGDSDRGCGKMLAKESAAVNVVEYPTVAPSGAWTRDEA